MFNLWGITIHWYGIILGLGVWVGMEIALRSFPKIRKEIEEAFLWALTFGVVGARLYHVVDYWNRYYQHNPGKILVVWEGGLGIWGAVLGATLGVFLYGYFKKKNVWPILEALAIGAPVAQAIGRLGNWVNGELYGRNGEPLFACEALLNLSLFIILLILRKKKACSGKLLGVYLIGYGVIRILLEGLRPNEIIWRIGGVPMAMIFGAIAISLGLLVIIPIYHKKS
ncbi:MAG: Prolipoprotein diacylglyceryl transferase [Candidatus Collierbacteria bacterium GW2011_GWC2_44_18]|uniref:Phosphatidylglycerol--prolipoprotein diacylglyceryl transferase n=1 Tax=Candidatus Collierbacteria bacterium GW2011_GWC2_44_18 TaxID=1618392 RepID=A0A0G1HPU8_9BACT|nr:MAG: Prolipoprotein diacylglyceryl transferase [Microgenomates group bacterium GW2011_GWC1_44_10]KKT48965.1 MAG: Prolipoprotein diacylglyceryl transferase [Candidatus Collierbacteria bacterium GW2011_GWC2_44_18]